MALARVKTWVAAEVLFASDLNAEFNSILNNPISLISPFTASVDAGGFDITALDELAFNDADADATAVRRLRATNQHLEWHDATGSWPLQSVVGGGIFGLTLSNNATDATNDIDIAVGQAIDDTEIYTLRLTTALTKRLDAAWAVGTNAGMLDTGAIANDTYHLYIIKRSDTGVTDVLASLSATAPTMPTNYDFRRLIGSIVRAAGAIRLFDQDGDYFQWDAGPLNDWDATNPGTTAVTRAITVPTGVNVIAQIVCNVETSGAQNNYGLLSDLATTDVAPSISLSNIGVRGAANDGTVSGEVLVRTNTSAQIRTRYSNSDASTTVSGSVRGFFHPRGGNA